MSGQQVTRGLALFDFDGTLTRQDTLGPFARYAIPRWRFHGATALLAPWIVAYRKGWLSGPKIRRQLAFWGFGGARRESLEACGRRYAAEHLASALRSQALERIRFHRAQGDTVVIVSASLDLYLRSFCEEHGLDLICNRLTSAAGIVTGRFDGGDCSGEIKARRVRERYDLSRFDQIYAYGDTVEDQAMLELASPSQRFFRWSGLGT